MACGSSGTLVLWSDRMVELFRCYIERLFEQALTLHLRTDKSSSESTLIDAGTLDDSSRPSGLGLLNPAGRRLVPLHSRSDPPSEEPHTPCRSRISPFLHDLITVLAAPTQMLSQRTGEIAAFSDRQTVAGIDSCGCADIE